MIKFKFRRKRLIIIYSVLFLIIIAYKSHDLSEDIKCETILISNEIKLKTFVANESRPVLNASTDPKWSPLIANRISVFSAFLFKDNSVRITSIVDQNQWSVATVTIECEFMRFPNSAVKYKTWAKLRVLAEHKFGYRTYAASEINCSLPRQYHSVIRYVAISVGSDRQLILLSKAQSYYSVDSSLESVVCIRPVFRSAHLISSVVEFLAYYRANEISKFVFYDLDIDSNLRNFLNHLNYVGLIPWKLTIGEYDIHAFGQRASIQDCLMRYSNSAIIFVDVDEFIVMQEKKSTIHSLIVNRMQDKTLSSLTINNRFICHEFQTSHTFPLILSHNKIQTYGWRAGDRSKMIVLRPDTVIDALIHRVTLTQDGYGIEEISDNVVLLYHYRSCCGINQEFVHLEHLNLYFKALNDKSVEDFRIKWFETQIMQFIDKYVADYKLATNPKIEIGQDI